MEILKITAGITAENTYFIRLKNNDCIVVDPGDDTDAVLDFIAENGLTVKCVLLTHAHFDHAGSAAVLQRMGAKIFMHSAEDKIVHSGLNLGEYCGYDFTEFNADKLLIDGEKFNISGLDFEVMHTPGHTIGSVCYLVDNVIFSGDTLFYHTIGRTDFPTGDMNQMYCSLEKLFALENDYRVLPGHDRETTLNEEKEHNPYA